MKLVFPFSSDSMLTSGTPFRIPGKFRRNSKSQSNIVDAPVAPIEDVLTFEQNLDRGFLSTAGKQLLSREELLFGQRSTEETEERKHIARDWETLYAKINEALRGTFNPENIPEVLTSAVEAIQQEEEQDRRWEEGRQSGDPPTWRPRRCSALHHSLLQGMVEERLDDEEITHLQQGTEKLSSVQKDIVRMAKRLKDDLLRVVEVVKGCYPDEMDICNVYASMYHQAFGTRLKGIVAFELCEKDSSYVLQWVNSYYPQMLKKQEFIKEIELENLGKLLPEAVMKPLEEQYITFKQEEVQRQMGVMLSQEEQTWRDGGEPELREGCYYSHLAFDLLPCVSGAIKSAEAVIGDRKNGLRIESLLKNFLDSFKKFQDDVQAKCKIRRSPTNSRAVVMANLNSVELVRVYVEKGADIFSGDEKEFCLSIVAAMKSSTYEFVLSPVHIDLKPTYRSLGTKDWLKKQCVFEKLLEEIGKHIKDLRGLNSACHQELMSRLHLEVSVEYVRRLLKGKITLKNKDMQERAAEVVWGNCQTLHNVFLSEGSSHSWLSEPMGHIAEVLKLQDVNSLQLEIASLALTYPDLSEKHVAALLNLKSNLSKDDRNRVKSAFLDGRSESIYSGEDPFFSKIVVK
ncbi:tumor necrosis factor alpha-induced protein 2 isoform X2 [Hypomesus transpacificus]|uniref:tumor necrosis factor alpha-induced protein 2 isoform X2 n=1 Tax=Hypomesus transpacificus TaxID=137520 RepID=UPI001F075A91|nr:tumor necrosis factor alpha-induced protein 2 isoform X2 [Hypomesus transpacificus]